MSFHLVRNSIYCHLVTSSDLIFSSWEKQQKNQRWLMKLIEKVQFEALFMVNGLWNSRKRNLNWRTNHTVLDCKNWKMMIWKYFWIITSIYQHWFWLKTLESLTHIHTLFVFTQTQGQGSDVTLEFSLPRTSCFTKAKEHSLPYYLPISGGWRDRFMPFPRALVAPVRVWLHNSYNVCIRKFQRQEYGFHMNCWIESFHHILPFA